MDGPEANARFARRLELPYPILSDPGKQVARAYGVLRIGLFAARKTFVIDIAGNLAHVQEKVSPKSAGDDLLRVLEGLSGRL